MLPKLLGTNNRENIKFICYNDKQIPRGYLIWAIDNPWYYTATSDFDLNYFSKVRLDANFSNQSIQQ